MSGKRREVHLPPFTPQNNRWPPNHSPVHQHALPIHEKILRHFDLSSQYGPCIGLPRLKRWKRAEGLGLRPPIEVLAVLMREEEAGNVKMERAYVEGLLGNKYVVGGGVEW